MFHLNDKYCGKVCKTADAFFHVNVGQETIKLGRFLVLFISLLPDRGESKERRHREHMSIAGSCFRIPIPSTG
ncbi:hypothetical protein PTKIN_Ptkin18bG0032600 [Pterospermum kingtungense]